MSAQIIDGKYVAEQFRESLRPRIAGVIAQRGYAPGLAVLLVGDDPASHVYVRNKEKAAINIGMVSRIVRLPHTASQHQVEAAVDALNADSHIDAFIVQLPLPKGLDEAAILQRVHPDKDADGLHPHNLGRLLCGIPGPRPCTPAGVMALLAHAGVSLVGKRAVVVGRSNIVGKPMGLLLLAAHATVTLCHSRTQHLQEEIMRADVVIGAVGIPEMIKGAWIARGAAVIDVGINRRDDGTLVGDVEFAAAAQRASVITPVPGGVGPMTIAMLMGNCVEMAENISRHEKR